MSTSPIDPHLGPADVVSRDDFLAYAKALQADLQAGGQAWESGTIEQFLDSLIAWAEDSGLSEIPSWRGMAELLRAGAFYE